MPGLNSQLQFRVAAEDDLPALRDIYVRSVETIGPVAYSPVQVVVWRSFAFDAGFETLVLDARTFIATSHSVAVGFCGVEDDGRVVSLYVRPESIGQGIGTNLLNHVLLSNPEPRTRRFYAEASRFSLPVFERCGFTEYDREQALRKGVVFERCLVERRV